MGLGLSKDKKLNEPPHQPTAEVHNEESEAVEDNVFHFDTECSNKSPKKPPPSENQLSSTPTKQAAKPARRPNKSIDPPHRVL